MNPVVYQSDWWGYYRLLAKKKTIFLTLERRWQYDDNIYHCKVTVFLIVTTSQLNCCSISSFTRCHVTLCQTMVAPVLYSTCLTFCSVSRVVDYKHSWTKHHKTLIPAWYHTTTSNHTASYKMASQQIYNNCHALTMNKTVYSMWTGGIQHVVTRHFWL